MKHAKKQAHQTLWQRLALPADSVQVFDAAKTAHWRQRWKTVYGQNGRGTGMHAFLWHVFSAGRYPSLEGTEAHQAYQRHALLRYIVLPNDAADMAFATTQRPMSMQWRLDFYVFPPNLAWTMAFTHEEGWIGPFFAQHPDYERLQEDNPSPLRRQEEIANAKRRGWM